MGSLAIGIPCLSAPLGTWVAFRIGTRPTVLMGLVIASAGLFLTTVAPTFEVLFFVYGLILPVGHIFVNTPPFFLLDEYFPYDHPRHVLTTSIIVCGFPLGMIRGFLTNNILPPPSYNTTK